MNARQSLIRVVRIVGIIPMGHTGIGGKTASCVGALAYQRDMVEVLRALNRLVGDVYDLSPREIENRLGAIESLAQNLAKTALSDDEPNTNPTETK